MIPPLPSDIFKPGQLLNNTYEIECVLGRGGMGEVYLATNQITGRQFAIKALSAQFSGKQSFIEFMKREEQMRSIQHDAVVRYSDCTRTGDGHVILVMDYVEGPSLNDVMLERRVDDRDLLIVAHRVLEGLEPTHAQGIVHRDLSPDNVILRGGAADRATIIDFGIAKDTSAGSSTIVGNSFAGKYEYAAPEQIDGRAEYRSDLYALGATLLAAKEGAVPQVGTSPGEIVRIKQKPLDTSAVREPLKGLIDWLAAPRLEDRPATAAEALARVSQLLKPGEAEVAPRRKGRALPLLAVAVLAAAGAGAWLFKDRILPPPLPVASPYELRAAFGKDGVLLSGHAPDAETAAVLTGTVARIAGAAPGGAGLALADGLPGEDWPQRAEELIALAGRMQRWEVSITDRRAALSGLAADRASRDALAARLDAWEKLSGFTLEESLIAGPENLPAATVKAALTDLATCGALDLAAPPDVYSLFQPIAVTGAVAAPEDQAALRARLEPMIGDRELLLETTVLNDQLCAIRRILPVTPPGLVSIRLTRGKTGEETLTGIFNTDDNPVVDVQIPASVTDASLWVMVVDNTDTVFHVLPNIDRTDHGVDGLGTVENGIRNVRVLWTLDEWEADKSRAAIQVLEGEYGKSEVIAILSRTPLFEPRRPRAESVAAVAQALAETLAGHEDQILGIASRIIDARP